MDLGYPRGSVIKWMVFFYIILTNHIIYYLLTFAHKITPMADFMVINRVLHDCIRNEKRVDNISKEKIVGIKNIYQRLRAVKIVKNL